jgi:hypothetical protein
VPFRHSKIAGLIRINIQLIELKLKEVTFLLETKHLFEKALVLRVVFCISFFPA